MSRRTKIILLIIAIIIAVLVIVYLILFLLTIDRPGPGKTKLTNEPGGSENTFSGLISGQPLGLNIPLNKISPPAENSPEQEKADLIRLAMPFVERFGSYSNQSNYQNLEDLMLYMSKAMKLRVENQIKEDRAKKMDASIYSGVSTKALSAQVVDINDQSGTASLRVSSQRRESTGSYSNAKIYYQNILVSFIEEEGVWKVDQADWQ